MRMSIDEARTQLIMQKAYALGRDYKALEIALDTLRKYQKIVEIVEHWVCCGNPSDSMIAISEVVEDGKID